MPSERHTVTIILETADTVTIKRSDLESLLAELEEAEDRIELLEYHLHEAKREN